MCVIIDRPVTSWRVLPGWAHVSMCTAVTLRRAGFEIPMQLLFCIVSHMAGTINTGSNCSSQPAKVQNRESDGNRDWGRGGGVEKIKPLPIKDPETTTRQGKK